MKCFRIAVREGLSAGLVALSFLMASGQSLISSAQAAGPAPTAFAAGKAKLIKGDYASAVKMLEAAVKARPGSSEAHLYLGQAYLKTRSYAQARTHLRAAIRLGKGSPVSQKANAALMTLPKNYLAPRTGEDTRFIAYALGIVGRERGAGGQSKPTVLDFYASWCHPCKLLEQDMDKVKSTYGDKVNFMSINVDDPSNEQVIEQYDVSPIPTVVFLSPDGQVVSYSIGYSGPQNVQKEIEKVLARS